MRLIIVILSAVISAQPYGQVEGNELGRCCNIGRQVYNNVGSCEKIRRQLTAKTHGNVSVEACHRTAEVCCFRNLVDTRCKEGKSYALRSNSCPVVVDRGEAIHKECCTCCLLAQEMFSTTGVCEPLRQFGHLCNQTFHQCCSSGRAAALSYTAYFTATQPSSLETFIPLRENRCRSFNPCAQQCDDYGGASVSCSCRKGFRLGADRHSCDDIDECSENSALCNADTEVCVNRNGSFECQLLRPKLTTTAVPPATATSCRKGYQLRNGGCIDVDECLEQLHKCNGTGSYGCVNEAGAYKCQCHDGFTFNKTVLKCQDVDECLLQIDTCLESQRCMNTPGSFRCLRTLNCGTGYYLDPETESCVDIDECSLQTHDCAPAYNCRNTAGSFRCELKTCGQGQMLNAETGSCFSVECSVGMEADDRGICEDVDECSQPQKCPQYQVCVNTVGSYTCEDPPNYCGTGYNTDQATGLCRDIDECAVGSDTCRTDEQCVNTEGSYRCECQSEGFQYNMTTKSCEDVDECKQSGGHVCSYHAKCENTRGSFRCHCDRGFRLNEDGRNCDDVDECKTGEAKCQQRCINVPGSYQCICDRGYTLASNDMTCVDIDECALWGNVGSSLCMGRCLNTPGSYKCECPSGYKLSTEDGRTCEDIDECREGYCQGADKICVNILGGYKCVDIRCPENYVQDVQFKKFVQDGFVCVKKCSLSDVVCIANYTFSISYQYATLPTLTHVSSPVEVSRIRAESIDRHPFYVKYVVDKSNEKQFGVKQEGRTGIVTVINPLKGPKTEVVKLHMNVYGRSHVMTAHNLAYITVFVSDMSLR